MPDTPPGLPRHASLSLSRCLCSCRRLVWFFHSSVGDSPFPTPSTPHVILGSTPVPPSLSVTPTPIPDQPTVPPPLSLSNPAFARTNPDVKKTVLQYSEPNFSAVAPEAGTTATAPEEARGKKRETSYRKKKGESKGRRRFTSPSIRSCSRDGWCHYSSLYPRLRNGAMVFFSIMLSPVLVFFLFFSCSSSRVGVLCVSN
ncbi:hypothetical protein BJY52DRAFT_212799 [Lactarius psammicola]|nr:hypothetical protein BJY52DRAFT_212799 [Lactarius psammicola]